MPESSISDPGIGGRETNDKPIASRVEGEQGEGAIYVAVGLTAIAAYARYAWRFARSPERAAARGLFLNSLIALPLVLGSLALDLAIPF